MGMRKLTGIYATTSRGLGEEVFTLSDLQRIRKEMEEYYFPVQLGIDPRLAPEGRMSNARIIEVNDGEYALECDIEIPEPEDLQKSPEKTEKPLFLQRYPEGFFRILYDRSCKNPIDIRCLEEISQLLKTKSPPYYHFMKFMNPIRIIRITGGSQSGMVGEIVNQFRVSGALGTLVECLNRRIDGIKDRLFSLELSLGKPERWYQVEFIFEGFCEDSLNIIGQEILISSQMATESYGTPHKQVYLIHKDQCRLLFVIRRDALTVAFFD